jgi:hypothetical protein
VEDRLSPDPVTRLQLWVAGLAVISVGGSTWTFITKIGWYGPAFAVFALGQVYLLERIRSAVTRYDKLLRRGTVATATVVAVTEEAQTGDDLALHLLLSVDEPGAIGVERTASAVATRDLRESLRPGAIVGVRLDKQRRHAAVVWPG